LLIIAFIYIFISSTLSFGTKNFKAHYAVDESMVSHRAFLLVIACWAWKAVAALEEELHQQRAQAKGLAEKQRFKL
jgi:hypothetical protein